MQYVRSKSLIFLISIDVHILFYGRIRLLSPLIRNDPLIIGNIITMRGNFRKVSNKMSMVFAQRSMKKLVFRKNRLDLKWNLYSYLRVCVTILDTD